MSDGEKSDDETPEGGSRALVERAASLLTHMDSVVEVDYLAYDKVEEDLYIRVLKVR